MRKLALVFILLLIVTGACHSVPDTVIPPEKMASLMADVHLAEAVIESNPSDYRTDSVKKILKQSVYLRHGVTQEQVDTSLMWYGQHIETYMEVYENTITILEDRIAEAEKAGGQMKAAISVSADGDSVNVWRGLPSRRFTTNMASDYLTFYLPSDKNWDRGDHYTLQAKMIDAASVLGMEMAVEYTDGTTEYVASSWQGNGLKRLELVFDSARAPLNLYGSIHYTPLPHEVAWIDSISLIRTRNHDDNERQRILHPTLSTRRR